MWSAGDSSPALRYRYPIRSGGIAPNERVWAIVVIYSAGTKPSSWTYNSSVAACTCSTVHFSSAANADGNDCATEIHSSSVRAFRFPNAAIRSSGTNKTVVDTWHPKCPADDSSAGAGRSNSMTTPGRNRSEPIAWPCRHTPYQVNHEHPMSQSNSCKTGRETQLWSRHTTVHLSSRLLGLCRHPLA